jgi:hypothetical protein
VAADHRAALRGAGERERIDARLTMFMELQRLSGGGPLDVEPVYRPQAATRSEE